MENSAPLHPQTPANPVSDFFRTVGAVLTRPHRFFAELKLPRSAAGSLFYAVVIHWIGAGLEYLWKQPLGHLLERRMDEIFSVMDQMADVDSPGRSGMIIEMREKLYHWFWGAGSVVIDPFLTVFKVLFTTLLVWVGVRLLLPPDRALERPERLSFETALAVICLGMTPSLLAGIPILGGFVATLFTFIVTWIAAKEVYRIGSGRALAIVLFPKILFFLALMLVFGLFFVGIARVFMSAYGI